jgi:DNA-binding MarR family transcriptional regulator
LAVLEPDSEHEYDRQILKAIASSDRVTQRSLSGELGVALGLTNLLIRRLVGKGYVRMSKMGTRHVRYFMTPAGLEALGRATRVSMANTVHLYTETREHIRASLTELSERIAADRKGEKRVVFYGAGDVAEIAFVSLQRTDLTLVGVVDDQKRGKFFDLEIADPSTLTAETIRGVPYAQLIVASIRPNVIEAIEARISERGIPPEQVVCL